jgi:hypothetical protein
LFLRTLRYYDLRNWDEGELQRLIEALARVPSVFLCHANDDAARVGELAADLRARRIDAWLDVERLQVGRNWREVIFEAIERTDFFAICLSPRSVGKTGFIQAEIRVAVQEYQRRPPGSVFLLPLLLEKCRLPRIRLDATTLLSDLEWMHLPEGDTRALEELVAAIQDTWDSRR